MSKPRVPFPDRLLRHEPMSRHTVARLGGPADYLYVARESTDELVEVAMNAWSDEIPLRVLGGGANVLVSDDGVRGLVLIDDVDEVTFGDWHDGRNVAATGGTGLAVLARKCQAQGLAGLEWAVSVPGKVGGAVVNNAGAHGGDMKFNLCEAVVLDQARGVQLMTTEDLAYSYRTSSLKARTERQFVVLMAMFALEHRDPAVIQHKMDEFIAYRKKTQPPGASLGSIFKNPPGDYAGRLIEMAGLKGHSIGGAQISPIHANFFINTGSATSRDYYGLIEHARAVVQEKCGVKLELEVELIGGW